MRYPEQQTVPLPAKISTSNTRKLERIRRPAKSMKIVEGKFYKITASIY